MAGYSDAAFRRICSGMGADTVVSEMISAMAMVMGDKKTADLAKIHPGEAPVILQIFGHDPAVMAKAADLLLTGGYPGCSYAASPAGIDINMGCPVKKITSNGEGSALMNNIPHARDIDDKMGDARRVLDWDAQFACALDPETAKAIRDARLPEDDHSDTCSMCGKFCAVRSMNKALAGEYIDIL